MEGGASGGCWQDTCQGLLSGGAAALRLGWCIWDGGVCAPDPTCVFWVVSFSSLQGCSGVLGPQSASWQLSEPLQ